MYLLKVINPEGVREGDIAGWEDRKAAEEKSSGFEIVWADPKEALRLLNLKQTSDYEGAFIEERDHCFLTTALEHFRNLL